MRHQRTASGLRLMDLRDLDTRAIRDPNRILAAMAINSTQHGLTAWLDRCAPADYDHLVVAEDRTDGRTVGILSANDHASAAERFLFVDAAFVAPTARKRRIMRRMLATALLQSARRGPVPLVIAVRTCNPMFFLALRRFARYLPGATLYPALEDTMVSLAAAKLARRIARAISPACRFEPGTGVLRGTLVAHGLLGCAQPMPAYDPEIDTMFARRLGPVDQLLAVLDLRSIDEATILDKARRLHRRR